MYALLLTRSSIRLFSPAGMALASLALASPPVFAATYYVAPSGSNSYPGSSAQPWLTLQHAADTIAPGDAVIVRPGTYVGFDLRGKATTPDQRITFSAEPGVLINAPAPVVARRDGINLELMSYVTIEGFTIIPAAPGPSDRRAGIRVVGEGFNPGGQFSKNVIIRNNRVDQWGTWGIFSGFADDIVVENNETSRALVEHGIYLSNSGDRPVLRGNRCWGNRNCGIQLNADIDTGDPAIPGVDGIISEAIIENNVVYDNGLGGGGAINCDGVQDALIQNNLLYGNHASGLTLYYADGAEPATGNIVANNTIVQASVSRWAILIASASTNNTLFNNIIHNPQTSRGVLNIGADCLPGFFSDYNVLTGPITIDDGSIFLTLAAWQSQYDHDQHSATAPLASLFADPAQSNYELAPNSPALNAGIPSLAGAAAPNHDLLNRPRPAGPAYDIGAYESQPATGLPGDLNCDGAVNVADIPPFVLALINPAAYQAQHPNCDRARADLNGDLTANGSDAGSFIHELLP